MNLWQCALPPLAAAALALPIESSIASTCKDELNRFESRLYDSRIAETDPQRFEELVRDAERAATLRDEQRCLERVSELKEVLRESAVPTPTSRTTPGEEPTDEPARPAAPILLVTDSEDSGSTSDELAPEDDEGETDDEDGTD